MNRYWKKAAAMLLAAAMVISGMAVPGGAQAAAKPKLNKKKVTIKVGKTVKLKLKKAKKKVTWSSNKKKVATVSKKGKVKGKKAGSAKITAKCAGKKYVCKVTVKKAAGTTDGTDDNPNTTQDPAATPTSGPQASATTTSNQTMPSSAEADTLAVGSMNVTLGMSKADVENKIGAGPDRTENTPQGFESYIYNPSMDYTNYTQIQFDSDKVVGIATISNYFRYEDLVVAGEDTASTLKDKGFGGMSSKYDYAEGYMYTGDKEYVLAFVDHQGSGKVYAVEVFAKQTSKNTSGDTKLDDLFKAEQGTYDAAINSNMAKELFDYACAFRAVKGLCLFTASTSSGAQKHSDDMASTGNETEASSDGTEMSKRFDAEYGYWIYSAECNSSRSIDAFGVVTWLLDNKASGAYDKLTKEKDKDGITISPFYLATGFSSNLSTTHITFATLDLYSY